MDCAALLTRETTLHTELLQDLLHSNEKQKIADSQ